MADNPIFPHPGPDRGARDPRKKHRELKRFSVEDARRKIQERRKEFKQSGLSAEEYRQGRKAKLDAVADKKRMKLYSKNRRNVRRGYNLNTLRDAIRMYGFLGRMEGPPPDNWTPENTTQAWYLQFECIDARWMDSMIEIMRTDGRLETVARFLNGQTFDAAWEASGAAARHELSTVYLSFVDALAKDEPFQGIFECLVDVRYLAQRHVGQPVLADWFELSLVERPDDRQETNGIFVETMQGGADDETEFYDLGLLRRLDEPWQGFMKAINFPNLEPPPPPVFNFGGINPFFLTAVDMLRAFGRKLKREWDRLMGERELWAPAGQVAGSPGVALPVPSLPAQPMMYRGHGGANTMAAGGANMPFVGVVDVGQGNLNMLVDTHWNILAYYDFGWTLKGVNGPAAVPQLCFCDRPTIIISNFDKDHWGMAEHYAESYGMRWIAPQFGNSTVSNTIAGRVRSAGGQYCLFNTSPGRRHIAFEWGYVERCTGGGSNGSGTAALVCVRDPGVAAAPRPVVPGGLGISPPSPDHARASAAVALVPALAPNADAIRAVTAALAASSWAVTIQTLNAGATVAQIQAIASAAVVQALATPGNVAAIEAALPNPPSPPAPDHYGFRSLANADKLAAQTATAQAAIGALAAANLVARCQAAADAIFAGNGASNGDQTIWRSLVRNVVDGWGAPPSVRNNAAPTHATERFILLTGDAFFAHVPSVDAVPPKIVGMTAAHHGSRQADGEMLEAYGTPWAPGSRQANAAHEASLGVDAIDCAVRAALALNPAANAANIRLAATQTCAAAVAAVRDAAALHPFPPNQAKRRQWGIVAAAAALSFQIDPAQNGQPAGVSAIVAGVANDAVAIAATFVSKVHDFFAAGAGLNAGDVSNTGLVDLAFDAPLVAAITGGLPAIGPNVATNASAAITHLDGALPKSTGVGPVFGNIAEAATARYAAGNGVGQANMVATAGGPHAADINNAIGLPLGNWLPANQAALDKTTILIAASGAAALAANVSPEDVAGAMEAFALNVHGLASSVRADPPSARIAYSYGVRNVAPWRHEYESLTLGNLGHGHPAAVQVYRSRGWLHRFNTSSRAHRNAAQGDAASPRGHIALCWDDANDAAQPGFYSNPAVPAGQHTIDYVCPHVACGNALTFNK